MSCDEQSTNFLNAPRISRSCQKVNTAVEANKAVPSF